MGPAGAAPTVILDAGAGEYSAVWSRVQELLSPRVRTCAYDRASWGWSEPGPAPRSMTQEVFELRALLDSAGMSGPYVMVGHSYGGLLVRRFVERYGDDVSGVVLIAPAHEDGQLGVVGEGWVRLRERATGQPVPEARRLRAGESGVAGYDVWRDRWPDEFQRLHMARLAEPAPLGNRPLVVLDRSRAEPPPPGTSEELWKELTAERDVQKSGLAKLSTAGRLVLDPASGHRIHVDNPELVARTIEEVVNATRPSPAGTIPAPDVSGTWQVTITTAGGTITGKASLEQAGNTVTGSIGPSEDATIRIEGVLNANKLALKTFPRPGRTAAFDTCELTVNDGRMAGTIEGGDLGKGSIEFVRDKRP